MVGMYEPYVEVCRLLDETWPGEPRDEVAARELRAPRRSRTRSRSRAAATGRPAVIVFDHAFHGRTSMTMAMTAKVVPYKQGFGPFPREVYRAPAPYPYRGVSTDDALAGSEPLVQAGRRSRLGGVHRARARAGRGRLHRRCRGLHPRRLKEICETHGILYVDDEVQAGVGRTGPVWAIEHYGVEPDLIVSGKSLGGGLPLAGVTGAAA